MATPMEGDPNIDKEAEKLLYEIERMFERSNLRNLNKDILEKSTDLFLKLANETIKYERVRNKQSGK